MVRSGAFHFAKLGNNLVLRSGAVCSTDISIFKMVLFFWNKVYIKKKWFVIDINLEKFLKWVFAF